MASISRGWASVAVGVAVSVSVGSGTAVDVGRRVAEGAGAAARTWSGSRSPATMSRRWGAKVNSVSSLGKEPGVSLGILLRGW